MFSSVVELYRACGRPPLEGALFHYAGQLTDRVSHAIATCEHLPEHFGRFEDDPAVAGEQVTFTWRLASNDRGRFYRSVEALVAGSQSVHEGVLPRAFYLVDDDYLVGEPDPPEALRRLERICELIGLLERLTGTSNSVASEGKGKALLFILPAGEKSPPKTIQLQTQIGLASLLGPELSTAPLRELVDPAGNGALHVEERRAIFRLAVADVAAGGPQEGMFTHLISHWNDVLAKFRHDVDCYVANFSFDKLRTELANVQTEFSAKLTKVMGDTASRFLALPLPYAALAGILKLDELLPSYLLFIGAVIVVLLYSATVHNQLLELARTESAFDLVFGRIISKSKQSTPEIQKPVQEAMDAFSHQRRFLRRTLYTLRVMAWVPIAGGLVILAYKFNPSFQDWFSAALQRLVL